MRLASPCSVPAVEGSRGPVLLLLGALLASCSGTPSEPPPDSPPVIIYMETTLGAPVKRILAMRGDGTERRVIFQPAANEDLASMEPTPDGNAILFDIYDGSPEDAYEWRIIPTAGGAWVPFAAPPGVFWPAWAPGADAMAWRLNGENSLGISTVGATAFIGLTPPELEVFGRSWSPDGTRLVIGTWTEGDGDLQMVTRDGAITPLLTGASSADQPSWSSATNLIAFICADPDRTTTGVCVIAPDGSSLRRVVSGPFNGEIHWSHDGTMIAAYRNNPGVGYEPVVVSVGTGVVSSLGSATTRFSRGGSPWSPADTRLLLLNTKVRGEESYDVLLVTDLAGHYTQLTSDTLGVRQAMWLP